MFGGGDWFHVFRNGIRLCDLWNSGDGKGCGSYGYENGDGYSTYRNVVNRADGYGDGDGTGDGY